MHLRIFRKQAMLMPSTCYVFPSRRKRCSWKNLWNCSKFVVIIFSWELLLSHLWRELSILKGSLKIKFLGSQIANDANFILQLLHLNLQLQEELFYCCRDSFITTREFWIWPWGYRRFFDAPNSNGRGGIISFVRLFEEILPIKFESREFFPVQRWRKYFGTFHNSIKDTVISSAHILQTKRNEVSSV